MFVGHYAVGLVLKRKENKASLGLLFLAVQFVDVVFFPLVLLGIERLNIVEHYTQSTHFELEYMPYTHGLLASILWAGLIYGVFRIILSQKGSIPLVMAVAVLSHWFLDLIVHTPDLPLWRDTSAKLGFSLWNNAIATYALEMGLLVVALWVYLRGTIASSPVGKYAMVVFVGMLLVANAINVFGPLTGDNKTVLAVLSLSLYFLFAGIAHWLDGKRIPRYLAAMG